MITLKIFANYFMLLNAFLYVVLLLLYGVFMQGFSVLNPEPTQRVPLSSNKAAVSLYKLYRVLFIIFAIGMIVYNPIWTLLILIILWPLSGFLGIIAGYILVFPVTHLFKK